MVQKYDFDHTYLNPQAKHIEVHLGQKDFVTN